MLHNLPELSKFLHQWYDVQDGEFALENWAAEVTITNKLSEAWSLFGQLLVGGENWVKDGTPSPLATQDSLAGPNWIRVVDGRVDFAFENQGNWSVGYNFDDKDSDPNVWSNWVALEESIFAHSLVGAKLSEFLVTLVLSETIFFGWDNRIEIDEQSCDKIIWTGHYYNSVGFENKYIDPSHRIRTNNDRSLLALDWNGEFSGFSASKNTSIKRLSNLVT